MQLTGTDMNRRTILACAGSTFISAIAGCSSGSDSANPEPTTTNAGPSEEELRESACSHMPDDAEQLDSETLIQQVYG